MRAAILALLALTACNSDKPKPRPVPRPIPASSLWTATQGSVGVDAYLIQNSFVIPELPGHAHGYTRPGSLVGKTRITLRYRIDMPATTTLHPKSAPALPTMLSLYFQRRGDNMTAEGQYETYRWYSPYSPPLTAGVHEISASLDDEWVAVKTSTRTDSPQAFAAAAADVGQLGFVLGGGTGRAHGIYATGPATFTILDFIVE